MISAIAGVEVINIMVVSSGRSIGVQDKKSAAGSSGWTALPLAVADVVASDKARGTFSADGTVSLTPQWGMLIDARVNHGKEPRVSVADSTTEDSVIHQAWKMALTATGEADLVVEAVHSPADCQRVTQLLSAVWGSPSTEIVDKKMVIAMAHAGALVTAAWQDGKLVGGSAGFCGPPGTAFHSHILGLLPETTGRGLGRALKLYQRAWCLERGISTMSWTYDPLVARNAYFNISRLGAAAVEYLPDFYGTMDDPINSGQGSDRMLIHWNLTNAIDNVDSKTTQRHVDMAHPAVHRDADGPTAYRPPGDTIQPVVVAVPQDIELLRLQNPEAAARWRTQTRRAFTDLLGRGWKITAFSRCAHYVLHHEGT